MLLVSFEVKDYPFHFNIYSFENHLIGIEEDPKYLQLFEMEQFGSPADYFDWRMSLIGFGSLLDVHGLPISKSHENFNTYHNFLSQTETALKMRTRRWGNRLRK